MIRKDNESIIPPGVDSLPGHGPSPSRKNRSVQRNSKSESGAVRSALLDKYRDSRPIHKASPTRKVLTAVDRDDCSDVKRLAATLNENRRKAEPIVPQSGGYCSPTEVQQFANSIEHVAVEEKSLQPANDLSHHRTSKSDSNEVLLVESTFYKKDLNNDDSNVVVSVSETSSVNPETSDECISHFGPGEDEEQLSLTSEHSTEQNANAGSSNEPTTGSAPAGSDSDEGSIEYGITDVRKRNAHREDLTSSDDSSVEAIHKDNDEKNQRGKQQSRPVDKRATQLNQNIGSIYGASVNVDKPNISEEFDDDVDEVNNALPVKKMRLESCLDSRASSGILVLAPFESLGVQDLLAQARSNSAMEIDLRRLSSTGQETYCALGAIDSNPHPAPFPASLRDDDWCFGQKNYVKVPWSIRNVEKNLTKGTERKERGWVNVRLGLCPVVSNGLAVITDFVVAVRTYKPLMKCDGLIKYFDSLSIKEKPRMLSILTATARLVLRGPQLFTKGVHFLSTSELRPSATFSREQCACLLANSFFCTFPEPNRSARLNEVNMDKLLSVPFIAMMKMEFFLTYFEAVTNSMPTGCVTFSRRTVPSTKLPDWGQLDIPLKQVETTSTAIENLDGCLQVDFANQYIGGGVLSSGAVQEEIRFLMCPEMIVSLLICPKLENTEAVHIYGAQRFSSYTGYAATLQWKKLNCSPEKRDIYGRTTCELVAIDAIQFSNKGLSQYKEENLERELNKAFAGFLSDCENPRPIATGNWGCGAFNGDKEYKSLIQIMAASYAARDIIYVHFDDPIFGKNLHIVIKTLLERNVTVGMLYNTLVRYWPRKGVSVFAFVMTETAEFGT